MVIGNPKVIEQEFDRAVRLIEKDDVISEKDKKKITQFLSDLQLGKYSRSKVGKNRLVRYLTDLKVLYRYFRTDFSKITEKEVEQFYKDLENDVIRKVNLQPYANGSKNELIKTIRKFGHWYFKDDLPHYGKVFGWVKNFKDVREPEAITLKQAEEMSKQSGIRDAAIIMFLFDSGARVSEMMNVTIKDLWKNEDSKNGNFKVRIRISKTKPRTISIPICSKYLKAWLDEHPDRNNPEALLFPIEYETLRIMLNRKGKKNGTHLHPHKLRHSSVTHYANVLADPFKLDIRYGWVIGSSMSRTYIERAGIFEGDVEKKIEQYENNHLEKKIAEQDERIGDQDKKIAELMRIQLKHLRYVPIGTK